MLKKVFKSYLKLMQFYTKTFLLQRDNNLLFERNNEMEAKQKSLSLKKKKIK
jgi:hypothetical protein